MKQLKTINTKGLNVKKKEDVEKLKAKGYFKTHTRYELNKARACNCGELQLIQKRYDLGEEGYVGIVETAEVCFQCKHLNLYYEDFEGYTIKYEDYNGQIKDYKDQERVKRILNRYYGKQINNLLK